METRYSLGARAGGGNRAGSSICPALMVEEDSIIHFGELVQGGQSFGSGQFNSLQSIAPPCYALQDASPFDIGKLQEAECDERI